MSSSRLPKKIMLPLNEKPLIHNVIKQLQHSRLIEKIVVATSTNPEDDVIENYLNEINVDCFRGNMDDLVDRHYECAKKFKFSAIVRIPSDKPFIDPQIVDDIISLFSLDTYDYVSNFPFPLKFNIGIEVEIFSFTALEKAWKNSSDHLEREHIFPYFHNNRNEFKMLYSPSLEKYSSYRLTVDRIEDYKLVTLLSKKINKSPVLFSEILKIFKQQPKLKKINKNINFNEGQLRSIEKISKQGIEEEK